MITIQRRFYLNHSYMPRRLRDGIEFSFGPWGICLRFRPAIN